MNAFDQEMHSIKTGKRNGRQKPRRAAVRGARHPFPVFGCGAVGLSEQADPRTTWWRVSSPIM
jgi:hypothetical protein